LQIYLPMLTTKKEIYLIRHGETEFNRLGIVQGSGVDSDLNAMGRAQALAFFQSYKHLSFERVYTSALKRTHQTVAQFLDLGLPHRVLPELNEISWGEKEGRIPTDEDNDYYAQLLENWRNGNTHLAALGGESPETAAKRLIAGIKTVIEGPESLILVAMHGRAMRILLTYISDLPLSKMDSFPHQNTCLYKIDYCPSENRFSLSLQNDVTHFKHLVFSHEQSVI
jgi:broad specificity phosphatase PhoE